MSRPFNVLGIQQIALGGTDKTRMQKLWVDMLGLEVTGTFKSVKTWTRIFCQWATGLSRSKWT
jgi:hypothetical protein